MSTKVSTKNDFIFLKNKELEKTIEDSIQYIQIILKKAEEKESALYKEETYRVSVLYVVSIIEAILQRVIELRKEKIISIDYKYISPVDRKFKHTDLPNDSVVIAVQKKVNKENKRVGFAELVEFMKNKGLMKKDILDEILDINDVRNTFHFTKPRNKITCEIQIVEKAFDLLVRVIKGAPKIIKLKIK